MSDGVVVEEMGGVVTATLAAADEQLTVQHVEYNTYEIHISDGYTGMSFRMNTENFKKWRQLLEECTKGD